MARMITQPGPGDVVQHVAAADIAVGGLVKMGDAVGVALTAIATGATGSVQVRGVAEVTKIAGTAWAQGDRVDWDSDPGGFTKGLTGAAGDVEHCGIAAEAALEAATVGYVLLTPGTGTSG